MSRFYDYWYVGGVLRDIMFLICNICSLAFIFGVIVYFKIGTLVWRKQISGLENVALFNDGHCRVEFVIKRLYTDVFKDY